MSIPTRLKNIECKIKNHQVVASDWPIMGGMSTDAATPHRPTRAVTLKEGAVARKQGLTCPIMIELARETEFLNYLGVSYDK